MKANMRQERRASPAKKVSDARLKQALVKYDGMVAAAAREVGLSRQTVHERIRNKTELMAFMGKIKTDLLDLAQSALAYQMEVNHDRPSAEFILKNLGRDIGYGPQPELPPPPPDNSRRMTIIKELVVMMDERAATIHAQPADITPPALPPSNGYAKPNGNGHANLHGQDPRAQLLAAKKGNGKN